MNNTVVITGASGFIGFNLIKRSVNGRLFIVAIDMNPTKNFLDFISKHKNILFLKLDFTKDSDLKDLKNSIKNPCYLIHLGAYILSSSGELINYEAQRAMDVNVSGSLKLVRALKSQLIGVCVSSSLDVYGNTNDLPINEEHLTKPVTFYAASKLAMELFLRVELNDKMPFTILRFSHIYGPGDLHPKALESFISAVASDKRPVIFGDGSDLRDYVYIDDVVEVIEKVMSLKISGIFNVATGNSFSIENIVELVIKSSGKHLIVKHMERKQIRRDYSFDISKLKSEIGFTPKVSIEQGIRAIMDLQCV